MVEKISIEEAENFLRREHVKILFGENNKRVNDPKTLGKFPAAFASRLEELNLKFLFPSLKEAKAFSYEVLNSEGIKLLERTSKGNILLVYVSDPLLGFSNARVPVLSDIRVETLENDEVLVEISSYQFQSKLLRDKTIDQYQRVLSDLSRKFMKDNSVDLNEQDDDPIKNASQARESVTTTKSPIHTGSKKTISNELFPCKYTLNKSILYDKYYVPPEIRKLEDSIDDQTPDSNFDQIADIIQNYEQVMYAYNVNMMVAASHLPSNKYHEIEFPSNTELPSTVGFEGYYFWDNERAYYLGAAYHHEKDYRGGDRLYQVNTINVGYSTFSSVSEFDVGADDIVWKARGAGQFVITNRQLMIIERGFSNIWTKLGNDDYHPHIFTIYLSNIEFVKATSGQIIIQLSNGDQIMLLKGEVTEKTRKRIEFPKEEAEYIIHLIGSLLNTEKLN